MKYKSVGALLLIISSSTLAGNPLSQEQGCDASYYPNEMITGINNSSNWLNNGPGINVQIDGDWYGQSFSEDTRDHVNILYQTAMIAYLLKKPVNVCRDGGWLKGLELN